MEKVRGFVESLLINLTNYFRKSYYEIIVGKTSGILFKVENKPRSQITKKLTSIIEEFVDPQIGICPDVPVFSSTANEQFGFMFITDATLTTKSFVGAVVLAERVLAGKLMPMNKVSFYDDTSVII